MLKALGRNVLCEPQSFPTQTAGGLHLPEGINNQTLHAVVIHVGEAVEKDKYPVCAGDVIFYNQHSSGVLCMGLDGRDVFIIPIEEIKAYGDSEKPVENPVELKVVKGGVGGKKRG